MPTRTTAHHLPFNLKGLGLGLGLGGGLPAVARWLTRVLTAKRAGLADWDSAARLLRLPWVRATTQGQTTLLPLALLETALGRGKVATRARDKAAGVV